VRVRIALFRGINVGGRNSLPMQALREILAGVGRSKLAARVEKALGVDATARNWRTVTAIRELAVAIS
jgi:uncharacterized protein (DUF1697 family)